MNVRALLVLALCLVQPAGAAETAADPALGGPVIGLNADPSKARFVPWPMRGQVGDEWVPLTEGARIVAATPELEPLAAVLAGEIERLTGRRLALGRGNHSAGDILLRIDPGMKFDADPYLALDPGLAGLEQRLVVTRRGILVEGVDRQAVALASVTLLQALEGSGDKLRVPIMRIEDKPGSPYCGVMLDVARQWHPASVLRDVIDLCRLYKVPFLHLHLTDDQGYRLPSEKHPRIPTKNASYTRDEIRELVAYGDARGVTLVPEIEMPGHSSAMQAAMPEVFGAKDPATGEFKPLGMLDISNEAIYPVLEDLIAETSAMFPNSPFLHIGADEVNFSGLLAHPEVGARIAAAGGAGQVFTRFLNRIHTMVEKHGKQTVCWEGFGRGSEVNRDIIVMAWHGSSQLPQDLLAAGHRIINVPWLPSVYSSRRQNYEWNKWLLNLNEQGVSRQFDVEPRVIGGQMVLWEKGPDEAVAMLRDKVPARHERLYSPFARRSFDDFETRFGHTDRMLDRLLFPIDVRLAGLINEQENLFHDQTVSVTLESPIEGAVVRYTLDGSEPGADSGTLYAGPFQVDPRQAGEVFLPGYYGPRVGLRIRAFDASGRPLGSIKQVELRCEAPRIEYSLYQGTPEASAGGAPLTRGLTKVGGGVLARIESSTKLARNEPGNMVLAASGMFEARSAGEYRIVVKGENARLLVNDEPTPTPLAGGVVPLTLPVGHHRIAVVQAVPGDRLGVVLTMESYPPDPPENARRFTNEYLYQWMTPLPASSIPPAAPAPLAPGGTVDYSGLAFQPDAWKRLGLDFDMIPWTGRKVVFLTKGAGFDHALMGRWVSRLDGGWQVYSDLTGRAPGPFKVLDGKPVIAAVPSGELTCGVGCGFIGATGIELAKFYDDDFPKLSKRPGWMPHYVFYEMGRNFYTFGDRHSCFITGFAVFMRYVCMDALQCEDDEEEARKVIEGVEPLFASSGMKFLDLFTMAGGINEKTPRIKDAAGNQVNPSDQPVCYAAAMLRLRRENGGDEWVKRFFHELAACPGSPADTVEGALGQCWHWLVAASVAARKDLSPVFAGEWGMPLDPQTRAELAKVDWTKPDLSAAAVAAAITPRWLEDGR